MIKNAGLTLCALTLAAFAQQQPGERRVALVMGNSEYLTQPLKNPVNDARAIRRALLELNFEVMLVENAKLSDLRTAVTRFTGSVRPGDVALVFYSGHGMELSGENYLVPVDFNAQGEEEAKDQAYSANRLMSLMAQAEPGVTFIILDACRDNPFKIKARSRSMTRGLAGMPVSPQRATAGGTLLSLATEPGSVAADNPDLPNSRFTTALLRYFAMEGLHQRDFFGKVRDWVFSESKGEQTPFVNDGMVGEFFFRPSPGQKGYDSASFVSRSESLFREARESLALGYLPEAQKRFAEVAGLEAGTEMGTLAGREADYSRTVAQGETLASEGRRVESGELLKQGWSMFPHRAATGMAAANQYLLADHIPEAARIIAALRGSPDRVAAARAGAMLRELAPLEPEAARLLAEPAQEIQPLDETKLPASRRAAPVKQLAQAPPTLQSPGQLPDGATNATAEPPVPAAPAAETHAVAPAGGRLTVRIESATPPRAPSVPPETSSQPAAATKPSRAGFSVALSSAPVGAQFIFDEQPSLACKAPCTLSLPVGRHTALVTLPGYREARRVLEVSAAQKTLSVTMEMMGGTLYLVTGEPGALIIVDRNLLPLRTPARVSLPVGKYRVSLWTDAILQTETEFDITDGQLATLTFR
ncbi:MAG: caspase family protein [Paludibaculum sp.]